MAEAPEQRLSPQRPAGILLPQSPKEVQILVINPNSNRDMSVGIGKLIEGQLYPPEHTKLITFTASSGPTSIDNAADALVSAKVISNDIAQITPYFAARDAFIVACFSPHPLVSLLRNHPALYRKPVVGIFEASISVSLSMLPLSVPDEYVNLPITADPQPPARKFTGTKFGIVTTGAAWVPVLTAGVNDYLGLPATEISQSARFKGVESTGLTAEQLHTTPAEEVRERVVKATRRLVADGDVAVVVLGCAGMAGMNKWVDDACVEELGRKAASLIRVVDGIKAGVALAVEEARHMKQLAYREAPAADDATVIDAEAY
ncbi:hypothetical protein V494_08383 [Pseudogymnoascus sp. VKM F-4513 (FW-928)]|nr:hypothetical protein V494_08383 [Pseudogymnoascus sp. VKM F-4513 (FW-928)]